jgi:hypothetical protein
MSSATEPPGLHCKHTGHPHSSTRASTCAPSKAPLQAAPAAQSGMQALAQMSTPWPLPLATEASGGHASVAWPRGSPTYSRTSSPSGLCRHSRAVSRPCRRPRDAPAPRRRRSACVACRRHARTSSRPLQPKRRIAMFCRLYSSVPSSYLGLTAGKSLLRTASVDRSHALRPSVHCPPQCAPASRITSRITVLYPPDRPYWSGPGPGRLSGDTRPFPAYISLNRPDRPAARTPGIAQN